MVRALFPPADTEQRTAFLAALEPAMTRMRQAGARVEDVEVPGLDAILKRYKTVKRFEFKGASNTTCAAGRPVPTVIRVPCAK